jgi:hypothetical protein
MVHMGDERDGTKGCGHYRRLDFGDVRGVLETGTVVVGILLPGKAPPGVVGTRDGTALDAGLGVLRPEERVEVIICSLERSGFFKAPMTTLFHGSAPTSMAGVRVGSVARPTLFRSKPRAACCRLACAHALSSLVEELGHLPDLPAVVRGLERGRHR